MPTSDGNSTTPTPGTAIVLLLSHFSRFLLPPPITNVGHHFSHRCLLSHQLSLLITVESLTLGELLLLPPFSSSLAFCRLWLHVERELLFMFYNLINLPRGSNHFRVGLNLAQSKKEKKKRFVGPRSAQPN